MSMPTAAQNILIVMTVFASVTMIVGLALFIPHYFRAQKRSTIYKTIELFSVRGQPVPPEVLASLTHQTSSSTPDADLRRGVILLSVALALAIFGYLVDDAHSPLIGIAAFPALIGVAFLALHWRASRRSQ